MFGVEHLLDDAKRERLERSWAHSFQQHALPLIDESQFAKYCHPDNGRPNMSVRLVVGVLVLKEVFFNVHMTQQYFNGEINTMVLDMMEQ